MAFYDSGAILPVMTDNVLDGLQAAKRGEPVVLQGVLNLVHPKAEGAIDSRAKFSRHCVNQFMIGGGGIR